MTFSKYKIKRLEEEDIKPEETLADALSDHPVIESPISRGVFRVLFSLVLVVAIFISSKSYQFQVVNGDHYATLIEKNMFTRDPAPALRGIIYDSKGSPLVENIPAFDLIALHSELPTSTVELNKIAVTLSPVINITTADILATIDENKKSAIFTIKKDISKEEIAELSVDLPEGIHVLTSSRRYYHDGPIFSNILGYTAKVNTTDIKNDDYYLLTDKVGRLGLEQFYENELRGEHKNIIVKTDKKTAGNEAGDIINQNNKANEEPGHDLALNVDGGIQQNLFFSLVNVLSSAGLTRGAAVVQNSQTGAILGMVSLPTFDSNIFENSKPENDDKKTKLLSDANKPLFNRIVSGRYSPGSTIKPLLALMGLKEKIVTPETSINAQGSITVKSKYDPNVSYTFKDWKVHGITNLRKAIADSVDVYFYALGGGYGNIRGLGQDRIISYLKSVNADKILGIDMPGETTGFVPDEVWKKQTTGNEWYVGDTYNISIGQGDLGITPLWLNGYISAIANGGNIMKPYIVSEIRNPDGSIDRRNKPEVLVKMPFDQETLNIVKDGMRQTVESGTAMSLQTLPVKVAAKTGTAQFTGQKLNSFFVAFGPYENPEITITVLVESVESQGLAIRVAHDFLSWYFSNRQVQSQN